MTNLEKIEFFAHELKLLAKEGIFGDDCDSLFCAITKVLEDIDDMSDPIFMDTRDIVLTFKKDYELFSKLKDLAEKEGLL